MTRPMHAWGYVRLRATLVAVTWALVACGGGGSGGAKHQVRAPLPLLVEDTLPTGERIDVSDDDFFVFASGDRATYRATSSLGESIDVQREVVEGPDATGRVTVVESVPAQTSWEPSIEHWQQRSDGLYALQFMGDGASTGFNAIVGDLLLYPTPFYPVGSVRTLVRQGSLGEDLDGDGVSESFRLELQQTFIGFHVGERAGRSERLARFRNVVHMVVEPSVAELPPVTTELTEESIFAAHTGLISSVREAFVNGLNVADYDGLEHLIAGTLAGRSVGTAWNGGTTRYLRLKHFDLVFEPVHQQYYAGVSGADAAHPGTVARIDPATGAATYSVPLGSDVRSIAVSADGATLYAGIHNQAEIVRLSLPDLTVQQRIPIPTGSWAFSLAVSPIDPTVLAYYGNGSDNLRLVRNGTVQPRSPDSFDVRAEFTSNPALFSADGTGLFMYGSTPESGGNTLLRVPVLSDGFDREAQAASVGVLGRSLSKSGSSLVAGAALFRSSDLAMLGTTTAELSLDSCRALTGSTRWACRKSGAELGMAVIDETTFSLIDDGYIPLTLADIPAEFDGTIVVRLVPGPHGQVAVMIGAESSWYGDWIALFDNPDLR